MTRYYLEHEGIVDTQPTDPNMPYVIYAEGFSNEPLARCKLFEDAQRIVDDWNSK